MSVPPQTLTNFPEHDSQRNMKNNSFRNKRSYRYDNCLTQVNKTTNLHFLELNVM